MSVKTASLCKAFSTRKINIPRNPGCSNRIIPFVGGPGLRKVHKKSAAPHCHCNERKLLLGWWKGSPLAASTFYARHGGKNRARRMHDERVSFIKKRIKRGFAEKSSDLTRRLAGARADWFCVIIPGLRQHGPAASNGQLHHYKHHIPYRIYITKYSAVADSEPTLDLDFYLTETSRSHSTFW